MKSFFSIYRLRNACFLLAVLFAIASVPPASADNPKGPSPEVVDFAAAKEKQARALAKKLDLKISPDMWAYFKTAQTKSAPDVTNAFERLKKRSSQYEGSKNDPTVGTIVWQPALEVELAVEAFAETNNSYSLAFGKGVIKSIPPGSIYFGGTDPGRGLPTALSDSHADGKPFFTITQNALADGRYLDYIREMYGDKIHIPNADDSQKAFQDYLTDAQKRLRHDQEHPNEPPQIRPGEDVKIVNNRIQVSGQVAVMEINGLLVKDIFDANPEREFYIEESFPLDWMYPYLSPHELILKLNRRPLDELSEETLKKDSAFWTKQVAQTLGDWLTPDTSVKDICAFSRKTFLKNDFSGFKGDQNFVRNAYAHKMYSKLRSAIGGLYAWRASHAKSKAERERMQTEADFSFRQAFALCPYSPEAVYRYVTLLESLNRTDDALLIALTAQSLEPDNSQVQDLVSRLRNSKASDKK